MMFLYPLSFSAFPPSVFLLSVGIIMSPRKKGNKKMTSKEINILSVAFMLNYLEKEASAVEEFTYKNGRVKGGFVEYMKHTDGVTPVVEELVKSFCDYACKDTPHAYEAQAAIAKEKSEKLAAWKAACGL